MERQICEIIPLKLFVSSVTYPIEKGYLEKICCWSPKDLKKVYDYAACKSHIRYDRV